MTDERVDEIIEGMKGHEGFKYYLSVDAGKELREAGIRLEFNENGVRWRRQTTDAMLMSGALRVGTLPKDGGQQ